MNSYIILGIIWLVISEIIYILICKDSTKKEVKEDAILLKIMSLVISFFITFILFILYIAFKEYTKYALGTLGVAIFIVLFFYVNYRIGLRIAKKR